MIGAPGDADYPAPPPIATGLAARCPRCGKGRLFNGFLELAPQCEVCGLSFAFADSGDGPAVFVTLIAGFIVVGLALLFDFSYDPPWWIHLLVTLPLSTLVVLGLLRPTKAVLVALQYRNQAEQGRLDTHDRR